MSLKWLIPEVRIELLSIFSPHSPRKRQRQEERDAETDQWLNSKRVTSIEIGATTGTVQLFHDSGDVTAQ